MPVGNIVQMKDLEDIKVAHNRVKAEIAAVDPRNFTANNVDILTATSTSIGVWPNIEPYRDRAAKLEDFDIRNFDGLLDFAKATWYLYVTNLPALEPGDAAAMEAEVTDLRAKMLLWATPLAGSLKFSQQAVDSIKAGTGIRDAAGDVVSLVTLYRSVWADVRTICAVTEQDLERGAVIGPAVYAMASRRSNVQNPSLSQESMELRQAWTLLDRAYTQCRRAINYFRFEEGDVDIIAPSLRRNAGRRTASKPTEEPAITPAVPAVPATSVSTGPVVGGGGKPFGG